MEKGDLDRRARKHPITLYLITSPSLLFALQIQSAVVGQASQLREEEQQQLCRHCCQRAVIEAERRGNGGTAKDVLPGDCTRSLPLESRVRLLLKAESISCPPLEVRMEDHVMLIRRL